MSNTVENCIEKNQSPNQFVEINMLVQGEVICQECGTQVGDAIPKKKYEYEGTVEIKIHSPDASN